MVINLFFSTNLLFQATVCLCDRDTCNGPSLPPKEMIDEDHGIIDIEEVIRAMDEEPEEVLPEPVSSCGMTRTCSLTYLTVISFVMKLLRRSIIVK